MNLSPWYFLTKFLAYSVWMWQGVGPLNRTPAGRIRLALLYGFARLAMGFSIGLLIWIAGSLASSWFHRLMPDHRALGDVVTYASVYVPVRWFEWALFDLVIDSRARSVRGFFLGRTARNRAWRLGGIAISCLADIPVIADVGGLAVGRFMCRRVISGDWIRLTRA
jgi:hypothetical protein